MDKNYYEILEIDKKASTEIVEKAYKTLVKKYHPDLQEGSKKQEYEEKLKLINEAYEILSNPEKRKKYNQQIEFQYQQNIRDKYEARYEVKDKNTDTVENAYTNTNYKTNSPYNDTESNINADYEQRNYQSYENKQPQYKNLDDKVRQARQQAEFQKQYNKKMNDAINKAYHDAYIQDLKNRGYKIRYKKTFKDYINGFLSLVIFVIIIVILWQIPFVRNFFINMYEENEILHYLVDLILCH